MAYSIFILSPFHTIILLLFLLLRQDYPHQSHIRTIFGRKPVTYFYIIIYLFGLVGLYRVIFEVIRGLHSFGILSAFRCLSVGVWHSFISAFRQLPFGSGLNPVFTMKLTLSLKTLLNPHDLPFKELFLALAKEIKVVTSNTNIIKINSKAFGFFSKWFTLL